ncbi:MAG: hypothetical protein A2W90_05595 [Bacteroidetes bacterium GWF2_42_66]|nr:MAG: hypothetical protein A2W92_00975 [Bacteroidetes bacterium GWA2_42_15]OFX96114.1 MAG: hypothetical protein A2W89_21230 [Bacteroidetes bacterium GWE2_42_39]OFY45184.1 MAG: hypothetical protein A2W90_05595 [Bacteroidetes bacterium GWF2_42_66]
MKKIRLIILSIFIFQTSFCQENYIPGYIVSNRDTLHGFIDYRNWEGNPDKIFFKEKLNDKKSTYSPMDIKGFSVHDEMYKSAIVKTGISSTEINALELDAELQYAIDTTFLQTIIKGEKSLYFYRNEVGKAQFYIKQDSSYVLLIYNKYLKEQDGKTGTAENRKYLGQLSFYFHDCPTIQSKLTSTGYTKKSMENLFLDYYNCAQSKLEFQKKTEKTIAEFGVFAGLSLTSLKFNAIDYLMNADCDPSANLSAGLFFEVIPPRNQRKWSLNNELIFSSYKIKGLYNDYESENRYTIYHTTIGLSYLKMNNMLRYKYPVGNLFVYLNAGISNGFAISEINTVKKESKIYSSERIDEDVILNEIRKYEQGYILGLGTKYKRYSFEVRYENGNGMSVSSQLKSSSNRFYFLLGCKF